MQEADCLGQRKGGVLDLVGSNVNLVACGAAEIRPAQVAVEKLGAVQPAAPQVAAGNLGFAEIAADQILKTRIPFKMFSGEDMADHF